MPVGSELAERIQDQLTTEIAEFRAGADTPIINAIMRGGLGDEEMSALMRIRDGITIRDSIDDFVNEWHDFPRLQDLAKIAITHEILLAEGRTSWGSADRSEVEPHQALRQTRDSWLGQVLRHHKAGSTARRDFASVMNDVAFVTFNYDRCIERHLIGHLTVGLNVPMTEAVECLRSIPIAHLYGSVGQLPQLGGRQAFGLVDTGLLQDSANNIRTYTEAGDSLVGDQVAGLMASADRVFFLGCAFHDQNLNLLFPQGLQELVTGDAPDIFATTLGLGGRRLLGIQQVFENPRRVRIFEALTAGELLRKHRDEMFD